MLPLFFSVALDAAPVVMPAAGTYRYDAFVAGAPAGQSTLAVTAAAGTIKIDEKSTGTSENADTTTTSTLQTDATLAPSAYKAAYRVHDKQIETEQNMNLAVAFGPREATVTAGRDVRTFALGGSSKTFVVLDSSAMSGFFLLPAQMRAFGSGDTTALVPGAGTEKFLDVIPGDRPLRPAGVPAADVSISFAGDTPFVEWYDPSTLVVDQVIVPGLNLVIKRAR